MKKRHWSIGRLCFDVKVKRKHWWLNHHRYPWFRIRLRIFGSIEVLSCIWVTKNYPFKGTVIKDITIVRFQLCWKKRGA